MRPLISILIPAFNAEKWIADTIRSAGAQTWERKEIIVVDDGSTDLTLAIARRFESDHIHVVAQRNQGAAAARNKAYSLSQGDFIQWLDADDLLAPDKISKQIEAFSRDGNRRTLMSGAWGRFLYRPSRAAFSTTSLWHDLSPAEWIIGKMGQNLFMPDHSWLVTRELTEAAGPWDTELAVDDDGEYFCRLLVQCDCVRFVPEARVYYRASGTNTVSSIGRSNKKLDAQWRSMSLQIRYLRSLDDSLRARRACGSYLQNWLIFFYPERADIVKQMDQLASDLGAQLEVPRLSWKYSWIQRIFGWSAAKRARLFLPGVRWSFERIRDKMLLRLEDRRVESECRV